MTWLSILLSPSVMAMAALFLSVVWMLRDETDKTRPLLVIAMVINFFYGTLLLFVMNRENGLVPWKYDYVLFKLDDVLGVSAASVAAWLHHGPRLPLAVVYEVMVPMMIAWFLVARRYGSAAPLVLAYVTEMVAGPLLYAVVPGCGPRYAFGKAWLQPPVVQAGVIRLSGMPNAFPSLHLATALLFVFFAQGRLWRTVALSYLVLTAAATISTGEHYVIDLVPGMAFGCFAAYAGRRKLFQAGFFLAMVLAWSLGVRFAYGFLLAHPGVVRGFAAFTAAAVLVAIALEWRAAPRMLPANATHTEAQSSQS
jgi:hypothetical protein